MAKQSAKKATPATSAKAAPAKPAPKKARPTGTMFFTERFHSGRHWLPALLLLLFAGILYGASANFGYILDDELVIWKNDFVQKGFAGIRDILSTDSFMGYFKQQRFLLEGGRYRPLSLVTFAMEVGIFGNSAENPALPHYSHIINILLYGLSAVVLYRVLLGLFPLKTDSKWPLFSLAFVAALIFTAHPLHTEVVANIKGRDEILALLFSLLALYAAMKYTDTLKALWLVAAALFLLLGMLSKENAITFVVIIPLSIWFFGVKKDNPENRNINWSPVFWTMLGMAVLFNIFRFRAMGYFLNHGQSMNDLMNNPFLEMSGAEKYATIFLTLGWYLKLLFVPYPLTHDYYPYQVPKVGFSDWRALLSLALYLGMGIWALLNAKRRHPLAYVILYWIITLSIVSNLFVSVGTFMNERFAYMSSVAFAIAAAWFFTRQLPAWIKEKQDYPYIMGVIVLVPVLIAFTYITVKRVPDWKDAAALNNAAIKVSYNSARSHCFYVTSIYQDQYQKAKDPEEKKRLTDLMEYHINESLRIYPNYGAALQMKAAVAGARFDLDHQLDKYFHELEYIMEKIPTNSSFRKFVDDNMGSYLGGANSDKYVAFCHRVGYEFFMLKRNDPQTALHFLEFGLKRQTEDIRILEDIADVYKRMGNTAKENEFRARAERSRSGNYRMEDLQQLELK